ncbi:putative repeat protein (TIGR01451 family) [Conexibacter arvalis]|uniref:Putative repeat protein (TIGR01451 family) n=1 Tax=Conexibacter arvalis TaxID=912552 RepID=A0A840ILR4_9ACTN|nr:putative repeat protein (TIGR01451 family) [Conexibacter arvalis]
MPRGRRRRVRRAALAAALMTVAAGAAAPAASAAPWSCDAAGYVTQFDTRGTGGNTLFQRADRQPDGSYALTTLGQTTGTHINALAFRPHDGFMYAVDNTSRSLVRIENDGSGRPLFTDIGQPVGAPTHAMIVGAILADGTFFVWGNATTTGAIYDISGPTPRVVRTLSAADASVVGADVAVSPIDGKLYTTKGAGTHELIVDLATGTVTAGPIVAPGHIAGGQWFLPDGTLLAYNNTATVPQAIFAIDIAGQTIDALGPAPAASNVDAASCANGLALTKDVSPRTVTAGGELVYTYRATSRALQAGTLRFSDVLPAGMSYVPGGVTVDPTAFGTPSSYADSDTLTVSGPIMPGETVTITARVRVSPDHGCDVNAANQAQGTLTVGALPPITVDSDDPTTVDPGDETLARVVCSADLSIVKVPSASPAHPGQPLDYTLTVRNDGPSTARDVVVADTLPSQLTVTSVPAGCTASGQVVSCALGALAPGAVQTIQIGTTVAASATGTIVNEATVTGRTPDPDPGNNRSTPPTPIEELADLSIVKRANRARAIPGERITYTLEVANHGPSTARNVVVSDPLPAGVSHVSSDRACRLARGTVTCTVDTLAAGATTSFRIVVRVASSVDRRIDNTATVTSDTRDPDPGNNRSTRRVPLEPRADLSIVKQPSVERVLVGQQLFYTLVVRNAGPSDATGVTVTDTAGSGLTLLSAEASQGRCTLQGATVTCAIGRVASGGTAQVLVSARADAPGELVNGAEVEGDQEDPRTPNNRTTTRVPSVEPPVPPTPEAPPAIPQEADLAIVKRADRGRVVGARAIRYTLVVTNKGPGTATGVEVLDTPSLPVKVRSVRPTTGSCTRTVPIRCQLGTLAPGAEARIAIVVQPRAAGTLRNAASVTGNEPDPNAGDNLGRATTKVRGLLRLRKSADRQVVRAGGQLRYTLRVTNASGFALRGVRVCDRLPSGIALVRSAPRATLRRGAHCWTIQRLGAGATKRITFAARVLRGAAGRKVNTATATAPGAAIVRAKRAVTVAAGQVKAGGVTG